MIEMACSEIIDKNTFLIHFEDNEIDEITQEQSEEIHNYETGDGTKILIGLRVNAVSKSVIIDIKIKYPPNFYNPNYYQLLKFNEKNFQDFYNEIMNYNQTMDYNEVMDSNKSLNIRSIHP